MRIVPGRDQRSRLQFDLRVNKIKIGNVFAWALVILISVWTLLSGCANTQADSDSTLQKPDNDHEVHGEVGGMYGHTAR